MLLLLGIALFGGTIGARLFQKLRIPAVVGYIIIGILLGESGLKIVDARIIEILKPFNYFALGLIGFTVGGDLKEEIFSKSRYGKNFIFILLCEGIGPFLLVTLSAGLFGMLFFDSKAFAWALALLLGAIASATDPAAASEVLNKHKARGPLTTSTLGIIALDDGLALVLYTIAASAAASLIGYRGSSLDTIIYPLYEIGGAVLIGVLSGFILSELLEIYSEKDRILAFTIGMVLLVAGLSLAAKISMMLAVMILGVIVVNFKPHKSREVFSLVEGFTPPIYILFFVLVGAKLKPAYLTLPVICLIVIYLVFSVTGKALGAHIGARLSKAPQAVVKYLPFALFSQGGIALGLSILAAQQFSSDIGIALVAIIAVTTFITQIAGPHFTKFAVVEAGEKDLNITEEEIIRQTKAKDVMDKNPPIIYENVKLTDILKIFGESDAVYYPVINKDKRLRGIITVEGIKQAFLERDTGELIVASDLTHAPVAKVNTETSLADVRETLNRYDIEYLPVVDKINRLEGLIERKNLNKFISTRMIELQKRVDSLDKA